MSSEGAAHGCRWPVPGASAWRWLLALAMFALLVLSLAPGSANLPTTGWDKGNHVLGFATLGLLARWSWPGKTAVALAALLAYGGLIELLQSFTPDRLAEPADLLADAVGLLLGAGLALLLERLRAATLPSAH